jgi:hypothetical protein
VRLPFPSALVLAALLSLTSTQAGESPPAPEPPPKAAPAPTLTPPVTPDAEQRPVLLLQVGAGMVAAAVAVPASFVTASWLGTASGNVLIALPALLIAALVPPVAVTLASWAVGNWGGPARFRLNPAIWITSGVSVLALVVAGLLGLNANEPGRVALFTAAEVALLPAAAVTTMQLTAAPPAPRASLLPGEPRFRLAPSVPVVRFSF